MRRIASKAEDPTSKKQATHRVRYRKEIETEALDTSVPVFDRLHTIFATQLGNWRPYHTGRSIEHMLYAENAAVFMKIHAAGGYVVGKLTEDPWEIVKAPVGNKTGEPRDMLGLAARFDTAAIVDDTRSWWHESYGWASERSEIGASVKRKDGETFMVGLPTDPEWPEYFAQRLQGITTAVIYGEEAIHNHLQSKWANGTDQRKINAMHAAVSIALSGGSFNIS